MFNSVSIILKK